MCAAFRAARGARYTDVPSAIRPSAPEFDFQNRRLVMSIEAMTKIGNLKSWTSGVDVDWESLNQLRNIAALPALAGHVARLRG
jgi:hypothetical protein